MYYLEKKSKYGFTVKPPEYVCLSVLSYLSLIYLNKIIRDLDSNQENEDLIGLILLWDFGPIYTSHYKRLLSGHVIWIITSDDRTCIYLNIALILDAACIVIGAQCVGHYVIQVHPSSVLCGQSSFLN